jgi:hypothetical protein
LKDGNREACRTLTFFQLPQSHRFALRPGAIAVNGFTPTPLSYKKAANQAKNAIFIKKPYKLY